MTHTYCFLLYVLVSAYNGEPDGSSTSVIFNYTLIDSPTARLFSVVSRNGIGEIRKQR